MTLRWSVFAAAFATILAVFVTAAFAVAEMYAAAMAAAAAVPMMAGITIVAHALTPQTPRYVDQGVRRRGE